MEYTIGRSALHVPFMIDTLRFMHDWSRISCVSGSDSSDGGYRIFTPVTKLFAGDPYNR
jgi:hypothetical protein